MKSAGDGRVTRYARHTASLALAIALLLLTACSNADAGGDAVSAEGGKSGATTSAVGISVTPNDGTADVRPDALVRVSVEGGRISQVRVVGEGGEPVAGAFDPAAAHWTSKDKLKVDTTYTITVTAAATSGQTTTTRTTFDTIDPPADKRLKASTIAPLNGTVVGVAQPLVVGFNHKVTDRQAVQDALRVETKPAVAGAWYWIDDQYVHYRPKAFWPTGTKVTLYADIAGVAAGAGMWGVANRIRSFAVARKQVIHVDVKRHRLAIERDGKIVRSFPVSTGKRGWETRNGIKVVSEKIRHKKWTNEAIQAPEDYTLFSDFAMRMTNSGEFMHDAPWNTGNIGAANTSHGCVGMYPKDMAWLFRQTIVGDPVIVSGSPRPYTEIWNRYMDWNVPWEKWLAGNA